MANDPIHQFQIKEIFEIAEIGGLQFSMTNSALFMIVNIALVTLLMVGGSAGRGLVPGRVQSVVEGLYEFIASTVRNTTGAEGMRFFPLVFTLFIFVLMANLLGMFPYFFTVTSHLIVTLSLALLVMAVVVGFGFYKHGTGFLKLFVPHGVPAVILPFIMIIEVISFLARPVSLSLRLFGNMLAGHIVLKVFAGFVISLGTLGFVGIIGAIFPLVMVIALTAFEFFVAFLQAFVFAVLTCVYLNDALHPHH